MMSVALLNVYLLQYYKWKHVYVNDVLDLLGSLTVFASLLAAGSINISNILTGKCLAKIKASKNVENECNCNGDCCSSNCSSKKRAQSSRIRSTVAEALEDITALFYDEERNEIYTGNRLGLVHVWSN